MSEITRTIAENISRQFFLLSLVRRVLAAWFKILINLLFTASKCHVTIQRQ